MDKSSGSKTYPRRSSPPPALIMAAGRGNRLLPLTHDRPKCLLEVGPATILDYQLQALRAAGVERIEIVVGHGEGLVRQTCAGLAGDGVTFSLNEYYATTSSLYSFGCVRTVPDERGFLILNSDVLFHPTLLRRLIDDPREQVLLADFTGSLGEEEMKIIVDNDYRITAISKALDPPAAQAENVGVLKVGQAAAGRMLELARRPGQVEGLCWIPDAIQALVEEFDFFALPTAGLPWIEIDYAHDLKRAREKVWPLLVKQ
jgi:choline kinase